VNKLLPRAIYRECQRECRCDKHGEVAHYLPSRPKNPHDYLDTADNDPVPHHGKLTADLDNQSGHSSTVCFL